MATPAGGSPGTVVDALDAQRTGRLVADEDPHLGGLGRVAADA